MNQSKQTSKPSKFQYWVAIAVVVLFLSGSTLSMVSLYQQQGNARVVNYMGIVRGATQRLVKSELNHLPNDELIEYLDVIVEELSAGEGPNNLNVLQDATYLDLLQQVQHSWQELKREIRAVRSGGDTRYLFDLSEAYFVLADRTVSAAEAYSERQLNDSILRLGLVYGMSILLLAGGLVVYLRSAALRRKAETLDRIAFTDSLTQLPNRAGCERHLEELEQSEKTLEAAVVLFDMMGLKQINEQLGYQMGDRLLADFARILQTSAGEIFLGRYGGNTFLAISASAEESAVESLLATINEKIVSYNLLHTTALERLRFSVGYVVASTAKMPLADMVAEADRRLCIHRQQLRDEP